MGAVGIVAGAWVTRRLWQGAQRSLAGARPDGGGAGARDAGAARTAAHAHPALPDGRRPADG
jgi:hypothetical protein